MWERVHTPLVITLLVAVWLALRTLAMNDPVKLPTHGEPSPVRVHRPAVASLKQNDPFYMRRWVRRTFWHPAYA